VDKPWCSDCVVNGPSWARMTTKVGHIEVDSSDFKAENDIEGYICIISDINLTIDIMKDDTHHK